MNWQRYPIFRIFLLFCAGILLANFTHTSFQIFLWLISFSGIGILMSAFWRKVFFQYANRWIFGFFLSLFFFSLGVVLSHLYSQKHFPHQLSGARPAATAYIIQLQEDPLEKERSFGVQAQIIARIDSGHAVPVHSGIMLYLQKNKSAQNLRYGDRILFKGTPGPLNPPMNPGEFDYKNYLNLKGIYYQLYADSLHWKLLSSHHGIFLIALARDYRKKMLSEIDRWPLSQDQKAVTKALLLGYRYDIQDDLLKAYASAGAMHVLAVSGLHVGIVYIIASYLLFYLGRIRYGEHAKAIILILLLWVYAMLTGLSASVVRAATMFTFVAIGTGFKRHTSIYNTILGSAMLLLTFQPTYLFEVGFQLSYAAVFGIVWLQPRLKSLWNTKNWLLEKVWTITTVSIAAQIATFPLGLYYFHQFPTLFLVSNLVVIPLVTLLMYLGLLNLTLSLFGILPVFMIRIFGALLYAMNFSVGYIEKQAYFLIEHIHITRWELVLLYAFILLAFSWLLTGGYRRLAAALVIISLFELSQLQESIALKSESRFVVYNVKEHSAIGFYGHGQGVFLTDSALLQDDDALTFHIKHHWWAQDIVNLQLLETPQSICNDLVCKQKSLIHFNNFNIWLAEDKSLPPAKAYWWIACGNCYPPDTAAHFPKRLILASDLGYQQRAEWLQWAAKHQLQTWDVSSRGAFEKVSENYKPLVSLAGND